MDEMPVPEVWSIDLDQVESPVLKRLIAEVRDDLQDEVAAPSPTAYDRIHNRYNRQVGHPYDRVHNRHNRGRGGHEVDEIELLRDAGTCRGCGARRALCALGTCPRCHRSPTRRGGREGPGETPMHLCCGWYGPLAVLPWMCPSCGTVRRRERHDETDAVSRPLRGR
jgi:hypothetical protein